MINRILLILIFISSALFSICQYTNFYDENWIITNSEKAKYYSNIVPLDNKWQITYYYISGEIKNQGLILDLDKMTKSGEFISYYKDGAIESRHFFKNGLKSGKFIWYYPNGKIFSEVYFLNDKKNGVQKEYFESGNLNYEMYFKNDSANGVITYFFDNIKNIKKISGNLIDDCKDGEWVYYIEDGTVSFKELYKKKYNIEEANIKIAFPPNVWYFDDKTIINNKITYLFKRIKLKDPREFNTTPIASVVIEKVDSNISINNYIADYRDKYPFFNDGIINPEVGLYNLKNAVVYKQFYNSFDHTTHYGFILFSFRNNNAITIKMDTTDMLYHEYENEFLTILKSIE